MQGKTKPSQLMKIGGALFKRISAGLGSELQSVEGTAGAIKQAEGLLANEGVVFLVSLVTFRLQSQGVNSCCAREQDVF